MNKSIEALLESLIVACANSGLKLEYTVTEYPPVKKPKEWSVCIPGSNYSQCSRCKATQSTFYTGEDDPNRPYTYYKYQCGICGNTWERTKIWD